MDTIDQRALLALALLSGGCGPSCLVPWYGDGDGDGYGDRDQLVEACQPPAGHVDNADDCDDRDASIHPGQTDSCNGIDDDCDGAPDPEARVWYADIDQDGIGGKFTATACSAPDGYVAEVGDCDDGDPAVYPGAVEICDGVDQDCDTLVDEGAGGDTLWYPDQDRDGWGDDQGARALCAPPGHWVTRGGDCDDREPRVAPGKPEICDGLDDDCDGYVDLDDPDGVDDALSVYVDGDGDGYGDGPSIEVCTPLPWHAQIAGDCDDEDPAISPAGLERCGGGDEDCDGAIDDQDPTLDPSSQVEGWADVDRDGLGDPEAPGSACALGGALVGNDRDCDDTTPRIGTDDWLFDDDRDGAGAGTVFAGEDCAPPSAGMVNVAGPRDCDDQDPSIHALAPDRCGDGVDQDCTGVDPACSGPLSGIAPIEEAGRTWLDGVSLGDRLGVATAGADFDGDGFRDVPIGAPGADGYGAVQILAGPPPEGSEAWSVRTRIRGLRSGGGFGEALSAVDDATDDGLPDLLIGAPDAIGAGEAYLYTGSDGFAEPWLTVFGQAGDEVGASVAGVGDVDGTGGIEVLIGAPGRSGAALVSIGRGQQDYRASRLRLNGSGRFGERVACCTDLGAGEDAKLAIAAPDESALSFGAGAVWIVDQLLDPGEWAVDLVESGVVRGAPGAHLGRALATGGDLDGDGRRDLAASAPSDSGGGHGAGKVYAFTEGIVGEADGVASWIVEGDFAGMALGQSLAIGDIDGDGEDDLAIGASEVDIGGPEGGAVYVFLGPGSGTDSAEDADWILYGPAGSRAGASLALGAIDADPGEDLWIGLPGRGPGAAWLVPGP